MSRKMRIEEILRREFSPTFLKIIDESLKHKGHQGAPIEGESHFSVSIASEKFVGLGLVARHKLVNACLSQEFATGLHALRLKTLAPGEIGS